MCTRTREISKFLALYLDFKPFLTHLSEYEKYKALKYIFKALCEIISLIFYFIILICLEKLKLNHAVVIVKVIIIIIKIK
jgi:hypothetical protein